MKQAIRFIIILMIAFVLAFSLAACGSSDEQSAQPQEQKETSQVDDTQSVGDDGIPALAVEGGQLVTVSGDHGNAGEFGNAGRLIQLQGVSTHGLSWFPQYVNKEMMQQTRDDWGCNVFRLAMYTAEYNGYLTVDDANRQTLKGLIEQAVADAEDLGMYIIIDWHTLSDNNPLINVEEARAFFAELSAKYSDKTHIIYEICNEPNGDTSWEDVKAYAVQVIPVIRQNTDAVILVGTPNWCQRPDLAAADPLDGSNQSGDASGTFDNIMYTLHFYAATHKDDLRQTLQNALDAKLPVFVSEFGICDASGNGAIDEAEADKWLALMNENGVSYTMWNLSNKEESSAMIRSDCSKTSGLAAEELSQAGVWFAERNDTGEKQ